VIQEPELDIPLYLQELPIIKAQPSDRKSWFPYYKIYQTKMTIHRQSYRTMMENRPIRPGIEKREWDDSYAELVRQINLTEHWFYGIIEPPPLSHGADLDQWYQREQTHATNWFTGYCPEELRSLIAPLPRLVDQINRLKRWQSVQQVIPQV
jgi:hypothetical protein